MPDVRRADEDEPPARRQGVVGIEVAQVAVVRVRVRRLVPAVPIVVLAGLAGVGASPVVQGRTRHVGARLRVVLRRPPRHHHGARG